MRPLSDSDVDAARSIVNHFLSLDFLYLSTSHKNVFCSALDVLVSTSKVPQSKAFISKVLAQTSSIFLALDHALKSNMEISSKLNALKEHKIEFVQVHLAKKQPLSELSNEYDAHKERIKVLTEELEMEKASLTSLVEQGKATKT